MPENNTSYRHIGPYVGVNSYTTYQYTTSSAYNSNLSSYTTLTSPYLTSSTTTSEVIHGTSDGGFILIRDTVSESGGQLNYMGNGNNIQWATSPRQSAYSSSNFTYPTTWSAPFLSALQIITGYSTRNKTRGYGKYPYDVYSETIGVNCVSIIGYANRYNSASWYRYTGRLNNVNQWDQWQGGNSQWTSSSCEVLEVDYMYSYLTNTKLEYFINGMSSSTSRSGEIYSVISNREVYQEQTGGYTYHIYHTFPYQYATYSYTFYDKFTQSTTVMATAGKITTITLRDVRLITLVSSLYSKVSKEVYYRTNTKGYYTRLGSATSSYRVRSVSSVITLGYNTLDRELATVTFPYVSTTTAYGGYIETTMHTSGNDPCLINNIYCPNELNEVKRIDAVYIGNDEDKAELVYKKEKFLLGLYKKSSADYDLVTLASSLDGITWHDLPNYTLLADELLRAGRPSNYRTFSYDNNPNLGMFIFYINGYYYSIYAEPEALSSTANLNYAILHIDKIDPDWNHDSVPEKIIYRVRYVGDFDSMHDTRFRNAQFNVELFKNDDFNYTLKVYGRIATDYTEIFINNVDIHFNENCLIDSIQSSSDADFNNDFVLPSGEYKENYYLTSLGDDALVRVVHVNDQNNNNYRREIYWKHRTDSEWTLIDDLTCLACDTELSIYNKNTIIGPSFVYPSQGSSSIMPKYTYMCYCLQSSNEYMRNFKFLRMRKDGLNELVVLYYDNSLDKVNYVLLTEDSVPGLSSALGNTDSVYALCALDNLSVENGELIGPILVWTASDPFVINGSNIYYITLSGSGWGARSLRMTNDYILAGCNYYTSGLVYFNRSDSYSEMVGTLVPDYGKFIFLEQPKPWIN